MIHLNNIHAERISIHGWVQKNAYGEQRYVTVDVRGEGPVYEAYHSAYLPKGDPYYSQLKLGPEMFEPGIDIKSEYSLTIYTNETDRLVRAWKYIYKNDCTGKKSPF